MSKAWEVYAWHVLDAIGMIQRLQQRGDLTRDQVLCDATLRNLETFSEATQRRQTRSSCSTQLSPWQQISGFRNILVHDYLGDIDARTVQAVATQHLSSPEEAIRAILLR